MHPSSLEPALKRRRVSQEIIKIQNLPVHALGRIFLFLEPSDITNISTIAQGAIARQNDSTVSPEEQIRWKLVVEVSESNELWIPIAKRIGVMFRTSQVCIGANEGTKESVVRLAQDHAKDLLNIVHSHQEKPQALQEILDRVKKGVIAVEDLQYLSKYLPVRDTLVVQNVLASHNGLPLVSLNQPFDHLIADASNFGNWIQSHAQSLQSMVNDDVSLSNLSLATLPDEIQNADFITILFLDHNFLRELPPLPRNLVMISCSGNQFSDFPKSIFGCSHLDTLYLDHNRIKSIPGFPDFYNQLISFSAHHNFIESLPPEFGDFTHLEFLSLSHNKLKICLMRWLDGEGMLKNWI